MKKSSTPRAYAGLANKVSPQPPPSPGASASKGMGTGEATAHKSFGGGVLAPKNFTIPETGDGRDERGEVGHGEILY